MKYHRVSARGFKIHASDRARAALGGEAALESLAVKEQLAAMAARMENRSYRADCPAEEQPESTVSIAADYGHVTGFYHCAAISQVMVLSRQRPSPDHILVSAAEYAEFKARHGGPERHRLIPGHCPLPGRQQSLHPRARRQRPEPPAPPILPFSPAGPP